MNISGILVVVSPSDFETGVLALNSLPQVQVHHTDAETGRIVVTQEAETVDDEVEGLKRIKALPAVAMAEMVYHYLDETGRSSRITPPWAESTRELTDLPGSPGE